MARVTVEDCVKIVPSRFDLVIFAAKRAREILAGASITVSRDNDKNPVVALREIAESNISVENLEESLIRTLQKAVLTEDLDIDIDDDLKEVMQDASQWHRDEPSSKKFEEIDDEEIDSSED